MTRTALPHPPPTAARASTAPRGGMTGTSAHPLPAEMRREAEASPLHETMRRDEAQGTASTPRHRNGHIIDDDTPTRRHTRRRDETMSETPRSTRRMDTIRRSSTPRRPSPQDMGERATRRHTRRRDEKRTRRRAKDEGKHTATPQDKRMTLRHDETPTSRTARPNTRHERPPRRRYGTRRSTRRQDETSVVSEEREARGHPRAMEQEITFRAVFPSSYKNETESG